MRTAFHTFERRPLSLLLPHGAMRVGWLLRQTFPELGNRGKWRDPQEAPSPQEFSYSESTCSNSNGSVISVNASESRERLLLNSSSLCCHIFSCSSACILCFSRKRFLSSKSSISLCAICSLRARWSSINRASRRHSLKGRQSLFWFCHI